LVLYQPSSPVPAADSLVPAVERPAPDGTDDRVQPRAVSAAGEDAYLHLSIFTVSRGSLRQTSDGVTQNRSNCRPPERPLPGSRRRRLVVESAVDALSPVPVCPRDPGELRPSWSRRLARQPLHGRRPQNLRYDDAIGIAWPRSRGLNGHSDGEYGEDCNRNQDFDAGELVHDSLLCLAH